MPPRPVKHNATGRGCTPGPEREQEPKGGIGRGRPHSFPAPASPGVRSGCNGPCDFRSATLPQLQQRPTYKGSGACSTDAVGAQSTQREKGGCRLRRVRHGSGSCRLGLVWHGSCLKRDVKRHLRRRPFVQLRTSFSAPAFRFLLGRQPPGVHEVAVKHDAGLTVQLRGPQWALEAACQAGLHLISQDQVDPRRGFCATRTYDTSGGSKVLKHLAVVQVLGE